MTSKSTPHWRSQVSGKLRCFAFARCRAHFLAGGGNRDVSGVAAMAAILGQRAVNDHFLTERHRSARPTAALKSMRRAHFEAPVFGRAVGLFDVNVEPYVRVRPFDFGDITSQGYGFGSIELCGKRMVCHRRGDRHRNADGTLSCLRQIFLFASTSALL